MESLNASLVHWQETKQRVNLVGIESEAVAALAPGLGLIRLTAGESGNKVHWVGGPYLLVHQRASTSLFALSA